MRDLIKINVNTILLNILLYNNVNCTLKGTVSVILSNPLCKDDNDSQRYPLNLYLINNVDDIDDFIGLKVCFPVVE